MQAQTPTVVAREAPRGGIRLIFCERGYTSSSIWGYCFLQLPAKDELVPALIWVLNAGQYPLHHSICLPIGRQSLHLKITFLAALGGVTSCRSSARSSSLVYLIISGQSPALPTRITLRNVHINIYIPKHRTKYSGRWHLQSSRNRCLVCTWKSCLTSHGCAK